MPMTSAHFHGPMSPYTFEWDNMVMGGKWYGWYTHN
jgi:hypothetical protein